MTIEQTFAFGSAEHLIEISRAEARGYEAGQRAMRERAAHRTDGFTCGACGMDGKAGQAATGE